MKPVQPHYNKPVPEQQPLHPQRSAGLGLGGASPAPIPWFSLYFWPTMTSSIAVITNIGPKRQRHEVPISHARLLRGF